MRYIDLLPLHESRGFAARRPGDEFVDPSNSSDIATFLGLTLLPKDNLSYETFDDLMSAIDSWKKKTKGTSYELNKPIKSMLAAMIVNMQTVRGLEHYILYTKDLSNLMGKITKIPAGVIPGHGGYILNKDVSISERIGLKPSDVLTSERPVGINAVAKLLGNARSTAGDKPVDEMQGYLKALAANKGLGYIIKGGAANAKLHQKYLGEWASPIALITGQFEPKLQLKEIQDNMTGGESLKKGMIIYNTDISNALFDSSVVVGDYTIIISTKAKTGGAAASLKGLYDTILEKADKFPPSYWRKTKPKKFKEIVSNIMTKSAIDGVLDTAEMEGIITSVDKARITQGLANEFAKNTSFKPTRTLNDYMSQYAANSNHPSYSLAKHALAAVVRQLTNKLNDEDFTDVVKQILNHANVVQMYFNAVVKGEDLQCNGFDLVWPPQFEGKIMFYGGKTFSATEIKGKLGFKIGKVTPADEPDDSLEFSAAAKKAEKKAADLAVGRITKPGEKDVRDIKVSDKIALGRAKKK